MAVLDPQAEHARLSKELQGLRAEMLRIKHAHPGVTDSELVAKLHAHHSLRTALLTLVNDALRLGDIVNAVRETMSREGCAPTDRHN